MESRVSHTNHQPKRFTLVGLAMKNANKCVNPFDVTQCPMSNVLIALNGFSLKICYLLVLILMRWPIFPLQQTTNYLSRARYIGIELAKVGATKID